MKVVWCCICHYGATYLREVVASTDPLVDKVIVLYAPHGSQGHHANIPCPESETELRACFDSVAHKLTWHRADFGNEGQHRTAGYEMASGSDLILQHDCDEVLDTEEWQRAIKQAHDGTARHNEIRGFKHYWRSLSHCCFDPWMPMRVIKNNGVGKATLEATVHHMSYAMPPEMVAYKLQVSGHRPEIRPRWFDDIFMQWPTVRTDLHPVCRDNWWRAEPVEPETLPASLRAHPNFGREVIQ